MLERIERSVNVAINQPAVNILNKEMTLLFILSLNVNDSIYISISSMVRDSSTVGST